MIGLKIEVSCTVGGWKSFPQATDPIYVDAGPFAGYSFAYFRGHDGLLFELFEVPQKQTSS
jgi:hypothetical protein